MSTLAIDGDKYIVATAILDMFLVKCMQKFRRSQANC